MLSIIIVNFYSENLVNECVESVNNSDSKIIKEIIIVDNGSNTDILEKLRGERVILVKNDVNKGFGAACNIGVKYASYDLILFLNPDTKVYKDTLNKAIKFYQNNLEITVLGCKQVNEFNTIQRSCARYLTLNRYLNKVFGLNKLLPSIFKGYHMNDWDHQTSCFVDHVIGSFYLIRKKDFINVNGFDEDYFVYYEDLDLSRRITYSGGKIYYSSEVEIFHHGGGASQQFMAKRLYYSLDSVLTYASKHFSKKKYFLLKCIILYVEPIIRIVLSVCTLQFNRVKEIEQAYKMLYKKRL